MKLSTISFGVAAIALAFTFGDSAAWDRHLVLFAVALVAIATGLGWAALEAIGRLLRPRRADMRASQRELDRAYRAGRDTGAAEGPTAATLRRWRSEGFTERGISNRDR
jgi:hypothetical protein